CATLEDWTRRHVHQHVRLRRVRRGALLARGGQPAHPQRLRQLQGLPVLGPLPPLADQRRLLRLLHH
ncbi:unnamed protein product, partial [Heterosigma akashiwo]